MATLTCGDITVEQEVGADLLGQLMNAGVQVPFLCMAGSCGTCKVKILSGAEHLSPIDAYEERHGSTPSRRLSCQAISLGSGDVVVAL